MKLVESQHVNAGMTITWGGALKQVLKSEVLNNQVQWDLSDGSVQTLPFDITIVVHNEKQ